MSQTSQMKKSWRQELKLAPGEYTVSLVARDSWDAESNVCSVECKVL